jgi:hypothetical protein
MWPFTVPRRTARDPPSLAPSTLLSFASVLETAPLQSTSLCRRHCVRAHVGAGPAWRRHGATAEDLIPPSFSSSSPSLSELRELHPRPMVGSVPFSSSSSPCSIPFFLTGCFLVLRAIPSAFVFLSFALLDPVLSRSASSLLKSYSSSASIDPVLIHFSLCLSLFLRFALLDPVLSHCASSFLDSCFVSA